MRREVRKQFQQSKKVFGTGARDMPLHLPELLLRFHASWLCHRSAPTLGREVPRRFLGRSMRWLIRRRRRSGLNPARSRVIGSWQLACCLLLLPFEMEHPGPIGPQSCRSLRTPPPKNANTPIYYASLPPTPRLAPWTNRSRMLHLKRK